MGGGGCDAEFSEGGTGGAGMPGCQVAGGARRLLPPPSGAVGPVVPPPLPGCSGGGAEQPLSSLLPSLLFQRLKRQRPECRARARNPERVRGPGLRGSRGLETWPPRSAGVEEARVWDFSSVEELRTQDSWFVWREGDQEPRLLGPWARWHGCCSFGVGAKSTRLRSAGDRSPDC